MHRSRLTNVVIDCAEADFEKGAQFWSAALGRPLLARNHVVMEAPSGHAFCVVPSRRGDFPGDAAEWP